MNINFEISNFTKSQVQYKSGEWNLVIKSFNESDINYDSFNYYVLLFSDFDSSISAIFYPELKKYFYRISVSQLSESSLSLFESTINEFKEVVSEAKVILKKETGIEY